MRAVALFQLMHPLRDGRPFPTLYWLADPALDRAVADLERRGWVTHLEQRIAEDADLRQRVHDDHRRYAAMRWSLLSPQEQAYCEEHGYVEALRGRGVGGTACYDHVKCLHAHVAHALADRNTLGQLVLDELTHSDEWEVDSDE